ncbi:MAG: dATP/dGTP diphosphohydrolase domain-containing protein [Rhodospirillaceae bacterium]
MIEKQTNHKDDSCKLPMLLPADPQERKGMPITTGVLDYFPLAIAEVARVSKAGNDQHNPGQPLHWARGKSMDHADCIPRHLIDRGRLDSDGMRHSAKLAWRALALLQMELEAEAEQTNKTTGILSSVGR